MVSATAVMSATASMGSATATVSAASASAAALNRRVGSGLTGLDDPGCGVPEALVCAGEHLRTSGILYLGSPVDYDEVNKERNQESHEDTAYIIHGAGYLLTV